MKSKRKSSRVEQYNRKASAWKKGVGICACCLDFFKSPVEVQVHHLRGRAGALLLDERYWVGVHGRCHRWIHDNMDAARRRGLLCERGDWGKQT